MQNVRVIDGGGIEYPFLSKGDTSTKLYRMVCVQLADYYDPAQVALDTPMSSATAAGVIALPFSPDLSAYFVGDTNHSHETGGMIRFERVFANIPQSMTEPVGSQIFTFPGLAPSLSAGTKLSFISLTTVLGIRGVYLNFSQPHGLSAGDTVFCLFSYTITWPPMDNPPDPNQLYTVGGYYEILDASSASIRIDIGQSWGFIDQVTLNLSPAPRSIWYGIPRSRDPITAASNTIEVTSFFLPGVSTGVSSYTDIDLPTRFNPVNSLTGESATTLNSDTIPTVAEYEALLNDPSSGLVVDSSFARWMGNIYKITTREVKPQ